MSFQKDFLWCVGGAAAQQDGGYSDGGKGLNIWDALSEGHIKNNDTCHIACKSKISIHTICFIHDTKISGK